jgi:TonB-linked SusC/RagA family outer membrane protein
MKTKLFYLLFLCAATSFYAQQTQISGTVISSEDAFPVAGANILVEGKNIGTSSDFDGNFEIKVNKGDILVIRYLGFVSEKVVITNQEKLNIVLSPDNQLLDEIVVVGYGTQKKKEVTGAVAVVGSEAIEKLNPTRVEQALQGQISGVNITSSSGAPGASANIRIRGISTNGDSRPLILVDGNPITELSVINPNDIKSVNVLKDATAGIYGVRAANGVILIETKTGRKNSDLKVTVDTYYAMQQNSKSIDVLSAIDYAKYRNNLTGTNTYFIKNDLIYEPLVSAITPLNVNEGWQKGVFQTAPMYSANVNFSGGTEKLAYSFGTSYLDQDGIIGGGKSNYNRLTARANLKYDILDNLKISATAIYTRENKNSLPEGGIGSVLYNAVNADPLTPIFDPVNKNDGYDDIRNGYGIVETSAIEVFNPNSQIAHTFNRSFTDKISPTLGVDYTFLENFTVSSKLRYNYAVVNSEVMQPLVYYGKSKSATRVNRNGYSENADTYQDYTWDNYITYKNTFNKDHNLTVLLAASLWREKGEFDGNNGENLTVNGIPVNSFDGASLVNADPFYTQPRFQPNEIEIGNNIFENRLASVFTRVQYNYKQKYLLSGVLRRDASSRFGPENAVGYFPSASVGWNVSEEQFLRNNPIINSFKLRASYGVIGNDKIDDFAFISRLDGEGVYSNNEEVNEADLLIGVAEGKLANPKIKWENQITSNFGFDLSLFDNKISVSVDAFNKKTEDLLIRAETSGLTGVRGIGSAAPTINAGTVENSGVEFLISYNDDFSEDFHFSTSFNSSTLRNEVTYVGSLAGFEQGGDFAVGSGILPSRMTPGLPIGYFHGYRTEGIYQSQAEIDALNANAPADKNGKNIYHTSAVAPGDLKFTDTNKDGKITEEDKTYIGDPIPEMTFGLNLGFSYKNIDFSASAFASIGNDMVRDYERVNPKANKSTRILDAWTPTNPSNTTPRLTEGASINTDLFSDYFVEDASYLRIQNIQLGYTFSQNSVEKIGMDKLRVYTSVNNLHTFTKYSGYDPSASSGDPIGGGIDRGFYPIATTYMLGLNLSF